MTVSRSLPVVFASALFISLALLVAPQWTASEAASNRPVIGKWGFDISGMDRTVKPGDNFFLYVGGNWRKTNEIPADRSRWGSFDMLIVKSENDIRDILRNVTRRSHADGSTEQKVADFYESFLDTDAIEDAGLKPVEADLAAIAAASTHEDIARLIARSDVPFAGPIALFQSVDDKNPDQYVMDVTEAGLGMPERDYYLDPGEKFADARAKYRVYIEKLLALANYPEPAKSAAAVMALETKIAEAWWPVEQRRDRDITYNPKTAKTLASYAPQYPWAVALEELGIPEHNLFIVRENTAVRALAKLFRDTPVAAWRAYLAFHELDGFADVLPKAFDDANFEFRGKVLSGQPEQKERWKRGVAELNALIGDALGELYVEKHFTPEAKARANELIANLLEAYKVRIARLPWMSPKTRDAALRKLASFRVMIGYPDRWKDYSNLEVKEGDPVGNRRRALEWDWQRQKARLAGRTDRDEWFMVPQQVNAYNNPVLNEIVFPAAILQPPFFDPYADDAINYGGIGGVIGHEIGHGFDDQGAKSDEFGILRTWWNKQDEKRFKVLGDRIVAQYNEFEPLPGLHVNGELTLGENIGDFAGVNVGYEAYIISLHGKEAPVLDGFTGQQRFYLGWAQVWRQLIRDEALRARVVGDPHSPAEYRVNGVVRNSDPWYEAFDVQADDKLYIAPESRVRMW